MSEARISRGGIAYEERGRGSAFVALHGYSLDRPFDGPTCFFLGRQDSSTGWRDALKMAALYHARATWSRTARGIARKSRNRKSSRQPSGLGSESAIF
jgi:hypothetical protein